MVSKVKVPPIKIQGIKTKLVPLIRDVVHDQEFSTWVEPFLGSGVVGFNLARKHAVFADTNPHLINFYNAIKSGEITPEKVRLFLKENGKYLEKEDDAFYYKMRERFNDTKEPLVFLFLNRSCFNGVIRFNKSGKFNVPYGHKPERFAQAYITKIVNQVEYVQQLIRVNDWDFKCQSFEKTITEAPEDSIIYCDPPYIGRHVDYYDSWEETDESLLSNLLLKKSSKIIVSTWDHNQYRKNEYIEKYWNSMNKITTEHFYHVGASENNRRSIMEALLVNFKYVKKNMDGKVSQLSF